MPPSFGRLVEVVGNVSKRETRSIRLGRDGPRVNDSVRGWTWRSYVTALRIEGAPIRSLAVLDAFGPWLFAFGLAVPAALIFLGLIATSVEPFLFAPAGLCIAGAGGALKLILVTRAGYNQGFALIQTPVRGCGVAGPAVKPGWST